MHRDGGFAARLHNLHHAAQLAIGVDRVGIIPHGDRPEAVLGADGTFRHIGISACCLLGHIIADDIAVALRRQTDLIGGVTISFQNSVVREAVLLDQFPVTIAASSPDMYFGTSCKGALIQIHKGVIWCIPGPETDSFVSFICQFPLTGCICSTMQEYGSIISHAAALNIHMKCTICNRGDKVVFFVRLPNAENLGVGVISFPKLYFYSFFHISIGNIDTEVAAVIIDLVDVIITVAKVISRIGGGGIAEVPEELGRHVGGDIGPLGAIEIASIIVGQRTHRLPLAVDHHLEGDAVAARVARSIRFGRDCHR